MGANVASKTYKIDDIDREIIRILQHDGRRSFAEMATQLKLAPSTVQQRTTR